MGLHNRIHVISRIFAVVLMLAASGCDMKDHFDETCYQAFQVKVLMSPDANDNFDLTPFADDDVSQMIVPKEVLIYVFNEQMKLLEIRRSVVGRIENLSYSNLDKLHIVAVGTAEGEAIEQLFEQLTVGRTYPDTDLFFKLTRVQTDPAGVYRSPIDFMYVSANIVKNPYNDRNVVRTLYLDPKIGAIKVVTIGLRQWADTNYGPSGLPDDEFSIVAGQTLDRYDLGGYIMLAGNQASYIPEVIYDDANQKILTPMFNLIPTLSGLTFKIYLYRNDQLIYPKTNGQIATSYIVPPRSPYIITINFIGDDNASITPAKFQDIYMNVEL